MPGKPQSTRPYLLTCGAQCEERRWPRISVISAPHSSTVTANSEQRRRRRSASCLRRSAYRRRPAPYRSARGTSESARFSTRTEPRTPKRIERAPRAHGAVSAAAALAKQAGARRGRVPMMPEVPPLSPPEATPLRSLRRSCGLNGVYRHRLAIPVRDAVRSVQSDRLLPLDHLLTRALSACAAGDPLDAHAPSPTCSAVGPRGQMSPGLRGNSCEK